MLEKLEALLWEGNRKWFSAGTIVTALLIWLVGGDLGAAVDLVSGLFVAS